ncbi:hypothetical protein M0R19_05780 [Candidatus Pacearchaeota archaeon]|nr:hypothetical protein [Candidatus Pacearchaeota archaeon]
MYEEVINALVVVIENLPQDSKYIEEVNSLIERVKKLDKKYTIEDYRTIRKEIENTMMIFRGERETHWNLTWNKSGSRIINKEAYKLSSKYSSAYLKMGDAFNIIVKIGPKDINLRPAKHVDCCFNCVYGSVITFCRYPMRHDNPFICNEKVILPKHFKDNWLVCNLYERKQDN